MPAHDLAELLHRVFGHRDFRAHQREVCEAAAAGRDVLLVMPTGAGKSLCYQLPALARGGTGLVISPLIALMDDQASKLSALGLRVARIHSGLDREASRQACRDYLAGELDFLFIAPERMRVPGFPEMLARRKPALVAIDEAHCISQWGHDFRPDYRTLGQHLPALRPAPIVALTATATPSVQRDIAAQLDLAEPAIFITGFRRDNLAVEVVEMSKPERAEFTAKLLSTPAARPAIVYAASRKQAEDLAASLSRRFPAKAYHAGLDAAVRERVQTEFLSGKLDVVVATVAFGMGVDKADVRTVVHVALPGSVEGYYQEIGRAGRDGKPSRTVLLHSYADRKTQEFLLDKNYPAASELQRIARVLTGDFASVDDLVAQTKMDRDTLQSVLDKLLAAGVAQVDVTGAVRATGARNWKRGYEAQVQARRSQIDRMVAFAEATNCRMTALVDHFGDRSDKGRPCGKCDICDPSRAVASDLRQPDADERRTLKRILSALEGGQRSVGKLFAEASNGADRKQFDAWLDGLSKAGLVTLSNDTFRADDGRDVTYRKAAITPEGRDADHAAFETVWLRDSAGTQKKSRSRAGSSRSLAAAAETDTTHWTAAQKSLEESLRAWRKGEAAKTGKPAFVVFPDATLRAIVAAQPRNVAALEQISGLGQERIDKYAADILRLCREDASTATKPNVSAPLQPPKSTAAKPAIPRRAEPARAEKPIRETVYRKASLPEKTAAAPKPTADLTPAQQQLEARLREWRKEEARSAGLPSFFIFSDTALRGIVTAAPKTLAELRSIQGIGPEKLDKFGPAVVELCRN